MREGETSKDNSFKKFLLQKKAEERLTGGQHNLEGKFVVSKMDPSEPICVCETDLTERGTEVLCRGVARAIPLEYARGDRIECPSEVWSQGGARQSTHSNRR